MNNQKIKIVKQEIKRFMLRVNALEKAQNKEKTINSYWLMPKEFGAVRRASMDLTRALAEMRKPG